MLGKLVHEGSQGVNFIMYCHRKNGGGGIGMYLHKDLNYIKIVDGLCVREILQLYEVRNQKYVLSVLSISNAITL